ncbi:cytochrome P450 [Cyathus striatus]|nr:cytochrome P450 [Cyathus striatus]
MPSNVILLLDAVSVILGVITVYIYLRSRPKSDGKLPPGPKRLPLIGNALDIPSEFPAKGFADMAKKYNSDIIGLNVLGTNIIVLNSYETAQELLSNRSAIYSSRPRCIMSRELAGFNYTFGMFPYDSRWRTHRRIFTKYLHPLSTDINRPRETEYVRVLLGKFLESPENFLGHLRHMFASIAVSSVYGLKVTPEDDPYVAVAERALETLNELLTPTGSFLVDIFPMLRMVPEWFPGAGFQKIARRGRKEADDMLNVPFDASMEALRDGTMLRSFVYEGMEDMHNTGNIDPRAHAISKGNSRYGLSWYRRYYIWHHYYFHTCNGEVSEAQKAAQRELDAVLGGRLPDHGDMDSIPYITALLREVLRWETVIPTGLPHYSTEDDVFRGYYIPAGTVIIPNQRCASIILLSSWKWLTQTERFLKEGKLNDDVRNPEDIAFGFGRRMCPGIHIAKSSLWITMASILSIFNIDKALDKNGNPIEPTYEFRSGAVTHPIPFSCSIKPRSKMATSVIQSLSE